MNSESFTKLACMASSLTGKSVHYHIYCLEVDMYDVISTRRNHSMACQWNYSGPSCQALSFAGDNLVEQKKKIIIHQLFPLSLCAWYTDKTCKMFQCMCSTSVPPIGVFLAKP